VLASAVRTYVGMGWAVMPLPVATKVPRSKWDRWKSEAPDREQWRKWWDRIPGDMNLAVVYSSTAAPEGKQLVCLDTDSEDAEAWVRAHSPLPATPTAKTAKGYHRYFWAPSNLQHVSPQEGLPEVRAGAHYTILPPSVHPSGVLYEWCECLGPEDVAIADLPPWGVALMESRETKRQTGTADMGPVETVTEGSRNETLFRKAAQWRANDVPEAALREAAHAFNKERCQPPLTEREVDGLVDSVLRYAAGTTKQQEARTRPEDALPAMAPEEEASLMASAEAAVNGIRTYTSPTPFRGAVPIADMAAEIIENVETRRLLPRKIYGMRSGWPTVDWFFGGFAFQGLMVLTADSGVGKTTVARHCIYSTADAMMRERMDGTLLVYMLEGEKEAMFRYYAGWKYGLPLQLLRPGGSNLMDDHAQDLLVRAYSEFAMLPIHLCDRLRDGNAIMFDVERRAQEGPIVGVVLDNVNLLEYEGQNDWKAGKTAALKAMDLADTYKFPFLALSQVNRVGREFKERGGPEWRNNATCKFHAERGESSGKPITQEEANRSNVLRLMNLKARHEDSCMAPLTLLGDRRTGRLWEERDYAGAVAESATYEVRYHDN
jgi:hypothetical protein